MVSEYFCQLKDREYWECVHECVYVRMHVRAFVRDQEQF